LIKFVYIKKNLISLMGHKIKQIHIIYYSDEKEREGERESLMIFIVWHRNIEDWT